jgi:NADH-quinone oxidoreductase subunit G
MLKLIIDDQKLEAQEGQTILQVAQEAGIEIPHYCYHPGLRLAGCCRMCQVEVEGVAKLQTACNTPVKAGMVVSTTNARVRQAQQAVMEFLLLNHPLDCPVCDQAGECGLQDYYMLYGRNGSRLADDKLQRQKAKPIGPYIILDQDRCILCLRCIRFCQDVSKSAELGVFHRGDHSVVDIYPGQELLNKYSGNLADICPVGALTDRDFRFQVRVWYLRSGDSICTGCSRGCNLTVYFNPERKHHAQGRRIVRLKPRFHAEVNSWWICDEGRYAYRSLDEQRLIQPTRRRNGLAEPLSWKEILPEIAARLKSVLESEGASSVAVWGSPQLPNEDLYLIRNLFHERLGLENLAFDNPAESHGAGDFLLIEPDKNPNRRGALWSGWQSSFAEGMDLKTSIPSGRVKALIIFRHNPVSFLTEAEWEEWAKKLDLLVFIGTNTGSFSERAHYVLPAAVPVEREGTFTNSAGRIQRFYRIVEPLGDALPEWQIVQRLASSLGVDYPYRCSEEVFRDWAATQPDTKGLDYASLGTTGIVKR